VACADGGGSFHEAAGSRSLRRFIIQPAEVLLSAGDGRWRFFPVGACEVRARRPEVVDRGSNEQ